MATLHPHLTAEQSEALDALLRNESDVAYGRRVRWVLGACELEPGLTVLDMGTGMGFYARAVTELCDACRVCGIDMEDRVLRYGQGHLPIDRVLLLQGDVQNLAVADASVDRVILSEVLEHLDDDLAALREVRRVLKPGGVVAITVPSAAYPYWYDPINRVAEGVFRRPIRRGPFAGIWANHVRLYDQDVLLNVVATSGLDVEIMESLTHYCFPATQTIVYTIGKTLVENNMLPEVVSRSADRFRGRDNCGSVWNPINWALGVFHAMDRLNENPRLMRGKQTFVNLAVKARKV